MQSYFIWNGVDSRAMGIVTRAHAPKIKPEERAVHVAIPGRSGDLTLLEGDAVYNSYIQTVGFSVSDGTRVPEVFSWLRGDGYVTFSGEPHRRQPARVIGAVTLDRVSRNLDRWAGQVQFYCQPLKMRVADAPVALTASGSVHNYGDVAAFPVILATPAAGQSTLVVTVNDKSLTISGVTGPVRIDCAAREVSDAGRTALLTADSGGPFPVLQPGENTVGGSGWSTLEIDRQERYL